MQASRVATVSTYSGGFAELLGVGRVPTAGGLPVQPGTVCLVVAQPGGQLIAAPISPSGGFARYLWSNSTSGDPGAGFIAITGTGSNPRTIRASSTDADGQPRNLRLLQPGDGITVTDDPAAPPISGFARYVLTDVPVQTGGYWTATALRTDTEGTTSPPPQGTSLRVYTALSTGGGNGGGVPAGPSAWSDYSSATHEISATAWLQFWSTLTVPPQPVGTELIVTVQAWLVAQTVAGDVRASLVATGGAVKAAGVPIGHTLYKLQGGPSTEQGSITHRLTVTDASVPTVLSLWAQQAGRNGPGQRQINFPGITAWRAL